MNLQEVQRKGGIVEQDKSLRHGGEDGIMEVATVRRMKRTALSARMTNGLRVRCNPLAILWRCVYDPTSIAHSHCEHETLFVSLGSSTVAPSRTGPDPKPLLVQGNSPRGGEKAARSSDWRHPVHMKLKSTMLDVQAWPNSIANVCCSALQTEMAGSMQAQENHAEDA